MRSWYYCSFAIIRLGSKELIALLLLGWYAVFDCDISWYTHLLSTTDLFNTSLLHCTVRAIFTKYSFPLHEVHVAPMADLAILV